MARLDAGRLDELETFRMEDDTPDDARVSLPWRDLRDLVKLIPVVRAAMAWSADMDARWLNEVDHAPLQDAIGDLRKD